MSPGLFPKLSPGCAQILYNHSNEEGPKEGLIQPSSLFRLGIVAQRKEENWLSASRQARRGEEGS